jgi:6-phosphogluconate dehydrogenase
LFESNVTEEEGIAEKIVDKIVDNAKGTSTYVKFLSDGWVPIEIITDSISATKLGPQKVIKSLKEQGYLEMKKAEKKQYDKTRYRCHKMTDKLKKLL